MERQEMDEVAAHVRDQVAAEVERAIRAARRNAAWTATMHTAGVLAFVIIIVNHRLGPVAISFVGVAVAGLAIAARLYLALSRSDRLQRWAAGRDKAGSKFR